MRWSLLLACVVALSCGCDQQASAPATTADVTNELRIVTYAPAITQMLIDLGFTDQLVAVAKYDFAAPPGLPIVGTYLNPDLETLLAIEPTHVLMMTGKEGAPRRLKDLAAAGRFELATYSSPTTVEAVARILYDDQTLDGGQPQKPISLGVVLRAAQRAKEVSDRMLTALASLSELQADVHKPSVLMVIGTNPIMACGPGTVHDQLLRMVGGSNAAADAKVGAPTYDRESLLGMQPEVILMLFPMAEPLLAIDEDPRLASFRRLPLKAVRDRQIVLINDPLVLLPSSSLVRIAVAMAKAIHPDRVQQIDQVLVAPTTSSINVEEPATRN